MHIPRPILPLPQQHARRRSAWHRNKSPYTSSRHQISPPHTIIRTDRDRDRHWHTGHMVSPFAIMINFSITPLSIINCSVFALAVSRWRQLNLAALTCVVLACLANFPGHTQIIGNDPVWNIYLDSAHYMWCATLSSFTLIYTYTHPEKRMWSSASCLGAIGIALSSDLFHMYVWLEVLTFAFLGFTSDEQVIENYWKMQIFAAFLVLVGVMLIYNSTGTMLATYVNQGSNQAKTIWVTGWLIKAGIGTWLLSGYKNIDKDLFYVACFSKAALIPMMHLNDTWLGYINILGALQVLCAAAFLNSPYFVIQSGVALMLLQNTPEFELYISFSVLMDAIFLHKRDFLSCIFAAGLPPGALFFIKLTMMQSHPYPIMLPFASTATLIASTQLIKNTESSALWIIPINALCIFVQNYCIQ